MGQKVQDIVPEEATARYGLASAQQPFTWVFDLLLYLLHNIGQATQPILIFLYCSDSPNSSSDDETGVPDGQAGVPDGQAGVPDGQAGVPDGQAGVPDGQAGVPDGQAGVPSQGQAGVPDGQAGVPAQGQAGVAGAGSFKESRGGRIFTWAGREEISSPDTSCSRCGQTLIFRFLFPAEKSMICQLFELPFKSNQFCSMQFLRVSATTSEGCCGALQRNVRTFVYS